MNILTNLTAVAIFAFCFSQVTFAQKNSFSVDSTGFRASPNEMAAYKQIEVSYSKGPLEETEKKISTFTSRYPKSPFTPLVQNIQGLISLQKKSFSDAISYFKQSMETLSQKTDGTLKYYHSILFNLAIAYFENSQFDKSDQIVNQVNLEELDQANRSKVSYLKSRLKQLRDKPEVSSNSVGVLLPMSGKFSSFGMKSLQALQLAFEVFNQFKDHPKLNLIVEDSGDQLEQTLLALNRLALKHRVVAVIGPMLTKGIDEVSKRAEELQIPLLSLARRSPTLSFEYVVQAGLTQQLQASEAARHAIEDLGIKKFAIVYPNEKLGKELQTSFWDAVETLGGTVVGIESYTPGQTDFRTVVDKLSGLFYTEARQRELELLTKERETKKITRRTKKTEQFYQLKPIVDYEAVFVADGPEIAGQILPTFAYRDIESIRFLGTSSWNSPEFLSRTQRYGENSLVVDAYIAGSKTGSGGRFAEQYMSTFGQEPSTLEALAYDAGRLLWIITSKPSNYNSISRNDLLRELKGIQNFSGVTGEITYKNGHLFRPLRLLVVKNGQFVSFRNSNN